MKTRVFNLLILDESGSMSSIEKQAVDSVNETLQSVRAAQKKYEDQEHFVSFVTFNSDGIKTILDRAEAQKAEDITPAQFNPACCTPLYDAIGISVNKLKKSVVENDKVLVTIITDGYENASKEYNQASIKALTEKLGKEVWTFAYIGANQDAMAVSHGLGIKNAMNFQATVCGTVAMSQKLTTSRDRWFDRIADNDACADENFFDNE
ncbi:MAG: VWA domain-containing protein [Prevotella sp.]|nr:VWA domain-containing protein [Candidatus Equicola stercoris]